MPSFLLGKLTDAPTLRTHDAFQLVGCGRLLENLSGP